MIQELLRQIKTFGCPKESDVTREDIQKKEAELGVSLPAALRDFYLMFHERDPIFSSGYIFSPLDGLKPIEKVVEGRTYKFITFYGCEQGGRVDDWGYGFSYDHREDGKPQLAMYSTNHNHNFTWIYEEFAPWLFGLIAWQQVRTSPNIADVRGRLFSDKEREAILRDFDVIYDCKGNYNINTFLVTKNSRLLTMVYCMGAAYIAIPNDKAAKTAQYMQELGLTYTWDKHDGVYILPPSNPRPPVKKRSLKSIQPAIDLALDFLGLPKGGLPEAAVAEAEQRLGWAFPLPIRETYLQIPPELLDHPDRLFPLEELAWDEQNKLPFFVGDQGIPGYAVEDGSPVVFIEKLSGGDWAEWALLDSFLAGEILWNTMCNEARGVTLTEFPACSKYALGPKGKLGKHLKAVVPSATKGGRRQLYTTPSHDILVLRDEDMGSTYLASVGNESLERLEREADVELSWL